MDGLSGNIGAPAIMKVKETPGNKWKTQEKTYFITKRYASATYKKEYVQFDSPDANYSLCIPPTESQYV